MHREFTWLDKDDVTECQINQGTMLERFIATQCTEVPDSEDSAFMAPQYNPAYAHIWSKMITGRFPRGKFGMIMVGSTVYLTDTGYQVSLKQLITQSASNRPKQLMLLEFKKYAEQAHDFFMGPDRS